ncbi:Putative BPI/LBP family protein [Morus notabilis]|uniref:Putative BPI/LBP family protein n=1 Tax=Morus notabilis TaxID=981085 RepID=W9S1W2_9ROSA|nr:Putative BPI/LBP family protein [Morus notabilis]
MASKRKPIIFFLLTALLLTVPGQSTAQSFTSVVISQKGLHFVQDLLVTKAIYSIIPLELPQIQKSVKIPFLGSVHMVLSNITIQGIDVGSSFVKPGDTGIVIVASETTCNLSMNWHYSHNTWLFPVSVRCF